jgi:hypothetical protein
MIELRHRMRGYEVVSTDDEEELSAIRPFPLPNSLYIGGNDEQKRKSNTCMW